jgi:hypothetical protein
LYVHTSALQEMPSMLRLYEGCAHALVGEVEGANVVKLYRSKPEVSYLSYQDFDRDPHPSLRSALLVNLQTLRVRYRDYSQSGNPPILHRKEEFVPPDYPVRKKFARLTRSEEQKGLYDTGIAIGTRSGWNSAMSKLNLRLRGHRLLHGWTPVVSGAISFAIACGALKYLFIVPTKELMRRCMIRVVRLTDFPPVESHTVSVESFTAMQMPRYE